LLEVAPPEPRTLTTTLSEAALPGLLEDLRGRLARARGEASAPRRAALIVALRYRIATERGKLDAAGRAALAQIEAEALRL
jgi:DEAD/DEAH box helicase domain-containing protein